MLNVESVFVLLIGWLVVHCSPNFRLDQMEKNDRIILPWIGVLTVKRGDNRPDAVSGIIMIGNKLALGNANEVGTIEIETLRKQGSARFHRALIWWKCDVSDRILHPEYFVGIQNTIAIIYLSCNKEDFYWAPVNLPTANTTANNIYSIALTDRDQRLQQITKKMQEVKKVICDDFYNKEQLNQGSLKPKHNVCYKELKSTKPCVNDAGMALAVISRNNWTLIAVSILGPGCSLPSRYIQIHPYVPWIQSLNSDINQHSLRRSYWHDENMTEPYEDEDSLYFHRISDDTIVMMPSYAYLKEQVYGSCVDIKGVVRMYREFGTIRAPRDTATAVYSLSVYDLFFSNITCVMVTVMCTKRSKAKYWISNGLQQEDIENYVKHIPIPHHRKEDLKKLTKIWYVKDTWAKYRTIKVANLQFKFQFTDEAKMDVEFFGVNRSSPMHVRPQYRKQLSKPLLDSADFPTGENDPEFTETNDSFYH